MRQQSGFGPGLLSIFPAEWPDRLDGQGGVLRRIIFFSFTFIRLPSVNPSGWERTESILACALSGRRAAGLIWPRKRFSPNWTWPLGRGRPNGREGRFDSRAGMGRTVFIFYFFPGFSGIFRDFPHAGQFVVHESGDFRVCLLAKFGDARRKARGGERTMPRKASGVRRHSEAATGLSAAGDAREAQPLPEPKRCRASLATALQTLRESWGYQASGFHSCRLCFFHAQ